MDGIEPSRHSFRHTSIAAAAVFMVLTNLFPDCVHIALARYTSTNHNVQHDCYGTVHPPPREAVGLYGTQRSAHTLPLANP